jgi:hypothetical protein
LPAENSTVMVVETVTPATEEEKTDQEQSKSVEDWSSSEPLDSLLEDLKNVEPDLEQATTNSVPTSPDLETNIQAPPAAAPIPTSAAPSAPVPQQSAQQKESVLVRLANRVKV